MSATTVQFLGSGDAFGSGGRLQTAILVKGSQTFLIDCGPSLLIAINRYQVDPSQISTIFLTHLHGDHAAGIPFFILHAQFLHKRTSPLTIAGPPGTAAWCTQVMETLFPGSSQTQQKFPLHFHEFTPGKRETVAGIAVTPVEVSHAGIKALALRCEIDGKTITYSGDTEWTANLIPAAKKADLFITECYTYDLEVKNHVNYVTLERHFADFQAKRIILTHMSQDMLAKVAGVAVESAEDGKIVVLE